MASIAIESRPVAIPGNAQTINFQHLYLVYTDDKGNEFTISGQQVNSRLSVINGDPLESNPLPGEGGDFRENTDAARTERHHTPLNLNSRDPSVVWEQMRQYARALSNADLPYTSLTNLDLIGESDNSNSTVAYILNSVGIDIKDVLPSLSLSNDNSIINVFEDAPGADDIFSAFANEVDTNLFPNDPNNGFKDNVISGSNRFDVLYGGYGDDNIDSGGGNDTLSGFTPFFPIRTDDSNDDEVDILTGGSGADLFILGAENGRFYQNTPASPNPKATPTDVDVEINPRTEGSTAFFLPQDITPQDFALITDFNAEQGDQLQLKGPESFNTEEGDFNTYGIIDVLNSSFINANVNEDLRNEISKLNLDPDAYSSALVYSQGFNRTEADFREDDIVTIFPGNFEKTLYGNFNIDLTPGSGDVIFV